MKVPNQLPNQYSQTYYRGEIRLVMYTSGGEMKRNEIVITENALIYVLEGEKEILCDGQVTRIMQNEMFLLPAGKYLMSEYIPHSTQFRSVMLFFDILHIESIMSIVHAHKTNAAPDADCPQHPIVMSRNERIDAFFQSLLLIQWDNNALCKALLRNKLEEIVLILLSEQNTKVPSLTFFSCIHFPSPPCKLLTVINDNLHNNLTIKELATLCHMSVSSFKRSFQDMFQSSPIQYRTEKRLEKGNYLLKHTSLPVTEIAYSCGFDTYVQFARQFKARFGFPASKCRN